MVEADSTVDQMIGAAITSAQLYEGGWRYGVAAGGIAY
jgi:hypothetical protein